MFEIGQFVSCGNKGVCKVQDITTLDIPGVDKDEKYYILNSVYSNGSTVYIPVALAEDSIRPVLTKTEADELISEIPSIDLLVVQNEKFLENEYKILVRSNDVRLLVKLLKTIYDRREKRFAAGRKETALDAKYFRMAAEYLFGELSISLDIPKENVEAFITEKGWE